MKKIKFLLVLLLAMTTAVFAQENDLETQLNNYLINVEALIEVGEPTINGYLEVIDSNLEIIKNSPIDEKNKEAYILSFEGFDGNGGFKFLAKNLLNKINKLEIQTNKFKEVLPLLYTDNQLVLEEFTKMANLFEGILESDKNFRNKFNETWSNFKSDYKIAKLTQEVLDSREQ